MELVRKGEEKLAFDHPTPIQIARYRTSGHFDRSLRQRASGNQSHHFLVWCCRDGRIWLTVLYKTWIKKDPATARAREAKKEAVLAALMGDEESLLSGKDKKKRKTSLAERKDKEKESKRPKTDDGMDLVQVKQERDEEAEAELPTHLKVMIKGEVKSEPAVRLESITKEESADVERKLKMDRTMSAVLLPSSFFVSRPAAPLTRCFTHRTKSASTRR